MAGTPVRRIGDRPMTAASGRQARKCLSGRRRSALSPCSSRTWAGRRRSTRTLRPAGAQRGRRCAPEDCPFLSGFAAMDMDERWVNRSPETMLETFTERLYEEATRLELRIIEVDTTM